MLCRYSHGDPLPNCYQFQSLLQENPQPQTHSSLQVLESGQAAALRVVPSFGATRGAPRKELVYPFLHRNAWRGRVGAGVDDEGEEDGGSGRDETEGTPAQKRSCRSKGSGHEGCLPLEEPRQSHNFSDQGCWSSTCSTED